MPRHPRVQLYDGAIPLGAAVRANLVTGVARTAFLGWWWAPIAAIPAVAVAVVVRRGFPLGEILMVLLSYLPPFLAAFVLGLTVVRTAWTSIAPRTHVLRLAMLRDGWRTAAVWVDQPKSGGPWRVQLIGALPFRRGLGTLLMDQAVGYADLHQATLTAHARTDKLAEVYARYGFTRDAPGSRHMTRQPKPI